MASPARGPNSSASAVTRLPVVLLLVVVAAVGAIVVTTGGAVVRGRTAEAEAAPPKRAPTVTIGWVGDITPGSQYGLPASEGRALFAHVRPALRAPDLMAGNLEGTFSAGGASKCGLGAANCFAFQAPPANAGALRDAGFDIVNLANNHAFDYGPDGQWQTLEALYRAHLAFTGLPGHVRVLTRNGIRVAFVGLSTYRWTSSMDDSTAVRALVDQAAAIADVVVVFFHAGAEGADRTAVPQGREYAYGEDRGDSRAFAHLAIDAGADVVLGSGPHVLRGMEVYRRRLIAYSLGNFAGAGNFASGGTLSLSGLLTVRVDRRGRLRGGRFAGMAIDGSGAPQPDEGAARSLVATLSAQDFGASAPRLLADGRLRTLPAR